MDIAPRAPFRARTPPRHTIWRRERRPRGELRRANAPKLTSGTRHGRHVTTAAACNIVDSTGTVLKAWSDGAISMSMQSSNVRQAVVLDLRCRA